MSYPRTRKSRNRLQIGVGTLSRKTLSNRSDVQEALKSAKTKNKEPKPLRNESKASEQNPLTDENTFEFGDSKKDSAPAVIQGSAKKDPSADSELPPLLIKPGARRKKKRRSVGEIVDRLDQADYAPQDLIFNLSGNAKRRIQTMAFQNAEENAALLKAARKMKGKGATTRSIEKNRLDLVESTNELRTKSDGVGSAERRNVVLDVLSEQLDAGDMVMVNDTHGQTHCFNMVHEMMLKAKKPGVLMLELPYALNWTNDPVKAIADEVESVLGIMGGPQYVGLAAEAKKLGWEVVPIDATLPYGGAGLNVPALKATDIPGQSIIKDKETATSGNTVLRQNYIARNVHHEMSKAKGAEKGAILLIGTGHLRGDDGVGKMIQMVGNPPSESARLTPLMDGVGVQLLDKENIRPSVAYTEDNQDTSVHLDRSQTRMVQTWVENIEKKENVQSANKQLTKMALKLAVSVEELIKAAGVS